MPRNKEAFCHFSRSPEEVKPSCVSRRAAQFCAHVLKSQVRRALRCLEASTSGSAKLNQAATAETSRYNTRIVARRQLLFPGAITETGVRCPLGRAAEALVSRCMAAGTQCQGDEAQPRRAQPLALQPLQHRSSPTAVARPRSAAGQPLTRHPPGTRRSCVYHRASPSPCRFFLPAPWILKWTWSSQSLRKQGCADRRQDGVRTALAGSPPRLPPPSPPSRCSPLGSRWSPPGCARRA